MIHAAHREMTTGQAIEDGNHPTPLAEVIPFPGGRTPKVAA